MAAFPDSGKHGTGIVVGLLDAWELGASSPSAATPLSRTFHRTHGERHATNNASMKVGMGWHILARLVGNIVWHTGGTGG